MAGTKKTSTAVRSAGSQSGRRSQPYQKQPEAKKSQSRKSPTKKAQLAETQASKSQVPSQAIQSTSQQANKPGSSQLPQSKDRQKSIPHKRVIPPSTSQHANRSKSKASTKVAKKPPPKLCPPPESDDYIETSSKTNKSSSQESSSNEDNREEEDEHEETNYFKHHELPRINELGEIELMEKEHVSSEYHQSDNDRLPNFSPDLGSNLGCTDEIQHDKLGSIFDLNDAEKNRAKEILSLNPKSQKAALVYHMIKIESRIEKVEFGMDPQLQPARTIPSDPTSPALIKGYCFDESVKLTIKEFARKALLEGNIHSYSYRSNSQGDVIENSLLALTSKSLVDSSPAFKRDHLPPGFAGNNSRSMSKVFGLVSEMLKTDRNTLRGCLLENIKTSSIHKEIKGPVPNLTKLISHIIKAFFPKEQAFLGASFDPAHVPQSRTRIAYLRLETIRYVFGTEKTNSAQWDLIDPQLEFIRGQSMDYYRA
ncbi:uncharacterized protein PGTG_02610 [Puccinia graminis f. sp. tritici CRL 75-36-700-3]|uniref:Uncharacterized protein n=1 Tax=Puccinia graminis f. sp. tritici (strain CRL 75-36-700-3 / race SCCL) TaxID=418459 RepID=E3JVU4_PUCGT|nr:uncharacterized protein PGTG_02610 [Puccinia graminis f. sp. tritici CRL 75-36-700-3]EFP76169.2 hypothetical protein PGTG_02610 [Puccinia graminis f. sp. tritici CRL 75-36-700-3]